MQYVRQVKCDNDAVNTQETLSSLPKKYVRG